MKKVYKNRSFLSLAIGSFISNLGDQMYNIGVVVGLYKSTGSILSIVLMWLFRASLRVPIQFIAGIISDTFDRKKIIILINLISAPIAASLMFLDSSMLYIMIFLIFILQATNDVETNAATSLVSQVVPKEDLQDANNGFAVLSSISTIMAPAVSAGIFLIAQVEILYLINGVTFFIAGLVYFLIEYKHEKVQKNHEFTLYKFGIQGFYQIIKKKNVFIALMIFMPFAMLGRFYDILKVIVADSTLNIQSEGVAYFSFAMGIGGLISPYIIKTLKKKINDNNYFAYSVGIIICFINYIIWGYSNNIVVSLISIGAMATGSAITMISLRVIIQSSFEKKYLGRVFAFQKIFTILSAIVGIIIAPIMNYYFGVSLSIAIIAIIGIIIAFIYCISYARNVEEVNKIESV